MGHAGVGRIPQNGETGDARIQPAKHVEPLRAELRRHERVAGYVSTRPRQACDQTNTDGIAVSIKNDGNRGSSLLCRKSGRGADRHNDIDPLSHQICCKFLQSFSAAFGWSPIDYKILTFHITGFVELAREGCSEK